MKLSSIFHKSPDIWDNSIHRNVFVNMVSHYKQKTEKPIILSDENFSLNAKFFNFSEAQKGVSPRLLMQHLIKLSDLTKYLGFSGIKVLMTVREQSTWLASRYAQSAYTMQNACQLDFVNRVKKIIKVKDVKDTKFEWLNYLTVKKMYQDGLGINMIKVISMEELRDKHVNFIKNLDQFLNTKGQLIKWVSTDVITTNKSSRGINANRWILNLEGKKEHITLSGELVTMIEKSYCDQSTKLV